jgi:hypothetical protein
MWKQIENSPSIKMKNTELSDISHLNIYTDVSNLPTFVNKARSI